MACFHVRCPHFTDILPNLNVGAAKVKGVQSIFLAVRFSVFIMNSHSSTMQSITSHSHLEKSHSEKALRNDEDLDVPVLIALFNNTFEDLNTRLVLGDDEPVYLPADTTCSFHRIVFAHGFFSSALHEIAHWCIAGKERRLLEDYGYWYCPDGRNQEQQAQVEQVEIKPQAVEWALACAAKKQFRVSTDNLNGAPVDVQGFQQAVQNQALAYLKSGFPKRAGVFIQVLQHFYQSPELNAGSFTWPHQSESIAHV